jgi:RNA polymerase sigma-70 factor (ECF subfamily)
MDDPSDLELIQLFAAPDPVVRREAFSTLFERHRKRAYDLAYRVLGDPGLAADAVQEAFLTVYRKGARFEARARFTSWLYRVVLNRCIDLQRRERRHRMLSLGPATGRDAEGGERGAGVIEPAGDPQDGPVPRALGVERAEQVRAAIARLSPKLAEVVILRYPQGRSYEEIGEILGVPPGTVKSRLNRAHAALRGMLESELGDSEGATES